MSARPEDRAHAAAVDLERRLDETLYDHSQPADDDDDPLTDEWDRSRRRLDQKRADAEARRPNQKRAKADHRHHRVVDLPEDPPF